MVGRAVDSIEVCMVVVWWVCSDSFVAAEEKVMTSAKRTTKLYSILKRCWMNN